MVKERVSERPLASSLLRWERERADRPGAPVDPGRRTSTLSTAEVLALQRLAGNRATAARLAASRAAGGPGRTAAQEPASRFAPRNRGAPATIQRQTGDPGSAPQPRLVQAHVGTAVGLTADRFLAKHRTELGRIVPEPAELRLLLGAVISRGILDADYNPKVKLGESFVPLTQRVFIHRHRTDKTPLKVALVEYGTEANRAKWPANNLNEQDWVELNSIKQNLVYPLLAFVVPRITPAPAVSAQGAVGEKIAAAAHNYLGLKYGKGSIVCTDLVKKVLKDLGLGLKARIGNVASIERNADNFAEVSAPQAGDLLIRTGQHVAIYAGANKVIHAPYTSTVVRLDAYKPDKWDKKLRYRPAR